MKRSKLGGLIILALTVTATVWAADDYWPVPKENAERKNPVPATSKNIDKGRTIYSQSCAFCHGDKGDGKGPGAEELNVETTNFIDGQLMNETTDGELFYRISQGRLPMPAYGVKYNEQQRWTIVLYLREMTKRFRPPSPPKK